VNLNVGGQIFSTTSDTLTRYNKESNFFSSLLDGSLPPRLDKENNIFIDRDPAYFNSVLLYLRTGKVICPKGLQLDQLDKEFSYYGVKHPSYYTKIKKTQKQNPSKPLPWENQKPGTIALISFKDERSDFIARWDDENGSQPILRCKKSSTTFKKLCCSVLNLATRVGWKIVELDNCQSCTRVETYGWQHAGHYRIPFNTYDLRGYLDVLLQLN